MLNKNKPIAIIGAGLGGCCTALELAMRGYHIELFEKRSEAMMEASLRNEGKIHLGLIYALDKSLKTAKQMIDGALVFASYIKRWMSFEVEDYISTPFNYCIHQGSLLSEEDILNHFGKCKDYYHFRSREISKSYLDLDLDLSFEKLLPHEYPEGINSKYIKGVIKTTELAVDTDGLAILIRNAIMTHPRITFRPGHEVRHVEAQKNTGYNLHYLCDGTERSESFHTVVNAAWYRRLSIDRSLGIFPPGPWSHRYKFGNWILVKTAPTDLSSLTIVQGPFGDVVNFPGRSIFLSWYPIGRIAFSTQEVPPDYDVLMTSENKESIFKRSLEQLNLRYAALEKIDFQQSDVLTAGGIIYALGDQDVDEVTSHLHYRHEVGIQRKGNYFSLDTGKYTLGPYWGVELADRIEGKNACF